MRKINLIVIHCSATPNANPLPPSPDLVIDRWHRERGFARSRSWIAKHRPDLTSIGYHYVIGRDGALYSCRHEDEPGAHAAGWNASSIGVCMVGTDKFAPEQWATLDSLVTDIYRRRGIRLEPPKLAVQGKKHIVMSGGICGHRDLPNVAKDCPGFDVSGWLAQGRRPLI